VKSEAVYTQKDIENIKRELQKRLSEKRFGHCCQVADIAVHFAKKEGYDENKTIVAALLHDVAREFTTEQMYEVIEKYNVPLSQYNRNFIPSLHGKAGAAIAQHEFNISDEEVLVAIRNHVSGRPCMGKLEQIIFLADHIDRGYSFLPKELMDEIMAKPAIEALYQVLGYALEYDAKNKKPVDERTIQTFDWLIETIKNEEKKGILDITKEEKDTLYHNMDELLEICKDHSYIDLPAENLRDIGGYIAKDGRKIRKGKIIRSGNLDKFTKSDFQKLSDIGINYIVDLRNHWEIKNKFNFEGLNIRYVNIPFEIDYEFKSYLEVLANWFNECDDPKESAWIIAKYFDAFDIDELYKNILFDPKSIEKFMEILKIMASDDCKGIMYLCNSGKDRTGIITAVIMSVLGFSGDVILTDYMVSQIPYYSMIMNYLNKLKKGQYNIEVQSQVVAVLGVEGKLPEKLNKEILKKYESFEQYLNIYKYFTKDEIKALKNKYLES